MKDTLLLLLIASLYFLGCNKTPNVKSKKKMAVKTTGNYQDLEKLFVEWREFEKPPLKDGAPDYTKETFEHTFDSLGVICVYKCFFGIK